jgi:CMP-N,N'-diacetyllegionaminic acid synthase
LPAGGKPLIAWTIEAGLAARSIDRLVLSSDNEEIMQVAKKYGCDVPFRRPDHLATDEAGSMPVILHALEKLPGYDYLVLLQPTSPLRTFTDIDEAFNLLAETGASACVSVCEAEESPYIMFDMDEHSRLTYLLPGVRTTSRRQDLKPAYLVNGAVYIAKSDYLKRVGSFFGEDTVASKMPRSRSLDIDTQEDFDIFKEIIQ